MVGPKDRLEQPDAGLGLPCSQRGYLQITHKDDGIPSRTVRFKGCSTSMY